jgi:hypothetical protein
MRVELMRRACLAVPLRFAKTLAVKNRQSGARFLEPFNARRLPFGAVFVPFGPWALTSTTKMVVV